MSAKASELTDPADLVGRVIYRNQRMMTKLADKTIQLLLMAGHNKADLRRLAEVLGLDADELVPAN